MVVAVGITRAWRREVRCWRALLTRLASARALDRLRRLRRRGVFEPVADWGAIRGSLPDPADSAEGAELADALRAALGRIPPKQAEVFCLHALEGWSYAEVAGHLGVSTDAVGVLLHRARPELRKGSWRPRVPRAARPVPRKEPS